MYSYMTRPSNLCKAEKLTKCQCPHLAQAGRPALRYVNSFIYARRALRVDNVAPSTGPRVSQRYNIVVCPDGPEPWAARISVRVVVPSKFTIQ